MKLPVKELYAEAGLSMNNPLAYEQWYLDALEKFAELVVRACADHVLESSDRYRKEYFANKILELIDGS